MLAMRNDGPQARDTCTRAGARIGLMLCLSAAVLLSSLPLQAQPAVELRAGVGAELPDAQLPVEGDQVSLSLEDAVRIALERNLQLVIQQYDLAQSDTQIEQNRGIFDLNLSGFLDFSDDTFPSGSDLDGADVRQDESHNLNLSLSQLTPFGGTVALGWNTVRFETNNAFVVPNPRYSIGTELSYTQPLSRGFGQVATQRGILIAQTNAEISRQTFEQQVISVIQQVENAYWNLVQARKQLEVSIQSLTLAQELHDRNRIKVEVGTLAPFELVQSEAGIAQREGNIIRDRATVGDAADELLRLLNVPQGDMWIKELVPETEPTVLSMDFNVDQAISTALEARSELRAQELSVENLQIDAEFFENQMRPQADLRVGYSVSSLDGDHTASFNELTDMDFTGWSARLTIGIPLQNRSARAQQANADLALNRGRAQLNNLEQQIVTEVRSAVRQLEAAVKGVEAARASREAQEKSLEAERKRYENGMSTSFQVLQIQDDLTQAQSSEVAAITSYRTRLADYYRAIGKLLAESGVELVLSPDE